MKLYIENKQTKIPIGDPVFKKLKTALEIASNIHGLAECEMSIILIDNTEIKRLNCEYRHQDHITDVISFALNDTLTLFSWEKKELGDIYISVERAEQQRVEYGHSFERELCYLAVHGLLHLLGFDHLNSKEQKIMREKEEQIMIQVGLLRE